VLVVEADGVDAEPVQRAVDDVVPLRESVIGLTRSWWARRNASAASSCEPA